MRCVKSAKKIYLYIPRFPPQKFQGMYLELGLEAAYGPTGLVHCVLLLQAGLNLPEVHYLLQFLKQIGKLGLLVSCTAILGASFHFQQNQEGKQRPEQRTRR